MYAKLAFGNVRRSLKDYGIYFATLVIGVCMFYAFNSITQQSAVLNMSVGASQMMGLLTTMIGGVSVFLAVIMGFLVVYANRFLIRRRKREFAIYLTLGMERGQISRIIVLETLLVGLVSLIIGLVLGYLLSQALLLVTAAMFSVKMTAFSFFFSSHAAFMTVACFGVMFLVALIFNVGTVSHYTLIDLISADRKNETAKIRSLPLSIALMIVAIGCIAAAYILLRETGFTNGVTPKFYVSTALVVIGTFLFFFSLSGVLLRVGQANKGRYLRGLNMFTLRQLNSRVNTAWVSVSLVCLVLFLALTSACGGFSIVSAFNEAIDKATTYDASYSEYFGYEAEISETLQEEVGKTATEEAATADGYDMTAAFARDVEGWNGLVAATAQVNYYEADITAAPILDATDYRFPDGLSADGARNLPLDVVPLSQLNAVRALQGLDPVQLGDGEYLIWCDFDQMKSFWRAWLSQSGDGALTVYGHALKAAGGDIDQTVAETSPMPENTGIFVVPDKVIPEDAHIRRTLLDIMYAGPRDQVDPRFRTALSVAYPDNYSASSSSTNSAWPFNQGATAVEMRTQTVGLTAVVSYLAIYIGIILLITCAAILALQQLSEAADNVSRYALIEKLGAEQKMVDHALYRQIGVYFIFPLVLALAHSTVAMTEVSATVSLLGHFDIAAPLATTALMAVVLYGGYYLITCSISKNMIRLGKAMRVG